METYWTTVLNSTEHLPPNDGIYPVEFEDGARFAAQNKNHAMALQVIRHFPPGPVLDRFGWDGFRAFVLSFAAGDDANKNPQIPLNDEGWINSDERRRLALLVSVDPAPSGNDPYVLSIRRVENLYYRLGGYLSWQAALTRFLVRYTRARTFNWRPAKVYAYTPVMHKARFSTPGSWQRVNRMLREDAGLKAFVEASPEVREAGYRMDQLLAAWAATYGVADQMTGTVQPGNRFPVPKRWWIGYLQTRLKMNQLVGDVSGGSESTRVDGVWHLLATDFRRAVAAAMIVYLHADVV